MPRKKNSKSSPSSNNSCQYCDLKLLKCSKCKNVSYCSVDCQQKDWVNHKEICKPQISEQESTVPLPPSKEKCCNNCGIFDVKLSKCSQCHEVNYCSKECQKKDWLKHKADCKKTSKLPSGTSQTSSNDQKCKLPSAASQAYKKCCNNCGIFDVKLSKCSQCHEVNYCSKECQKKDWLKHKADCKKTSKLPSGTSQTSSNDQKCKLPSGASQAYKKCCNNCGIFDVKLSKCSQCHEVNYCSKECQKKDWLKHKADCKKTSKLPSGTSQTSSNDQKCKLPSGASQAYKKCCNNCGIFDVKLSKCSQCHEVNYCSKDCQEEDWLKHKADCKKKSKLPSGVSDTFSKQQKSKLPVPALQTPQECCNNCGIFDVKLSKCSQCHEVNYCSKDCQKEDWLKHKADCKKTSKLPSGASQIPQECCNNCGLFGVKLSKCSQCEDVNYCSKECQKENWLEHQEHCGKGYEFYSGITQTSNPKCLNCFNASRYDSPYCNLCLLVKQKFQHQYPRKIAYIANLRFPTYKVIMSYDEVYFNSDGKVLLLLMYKKGTHLFRPSMIVRDNKGCDLCLIFYLENYDYKNQRFWDVFVPGNYICVKFPRFHHFLDGTHGFRIESLNDVAIIENF